MQRYNKYFNLQNIYKLFTNKNREGLHASLCRMFAQNLSCDMVESEVTLIK